jgi:hypothetical protein
MLFLQSAVCPKEQNIFYRKPSTFPIFDAQHHEKLAGFRKNILRLSLCLLVLWIFTNNHYFSISLDDFALFADRLY